MIWKRYQNEVIVLAALILMIAGYLYKSSYANALDRVKTEVAISVTEIGRIVVLKKQWGDETLTTRIDRLKQNIATDKIKMFGVKSKKLEASFQGLSDKEMSSIIVNLEKIAVQIVKLSAKHQSDGYSLEILCKW